MREGFKEARTPELVPEGVLTYWLDNQGKGLLWGRGQFEELRPGLLFAESINSTSLFPSFQASKKVWIIQLKVLGC